MSLRVKSKSTIIQSLSLLITFTLLLFAWYDVNGAYPKQREKQNEEWRQAISKLGLPTESALTANQGSALSDSNPLPNELKSEGEAGWVAGVSTDLNQNKVDLNARQRIDVSTLEQAKVVKVVDGDTIKVDLDGQIETVRLVSVDAPESVSPGQSVGCLGKESADFLQSLLVDQEIINLQKDAMQGNRDRYGRLLRFVFLGDGKDVGLELLKFGLAKAKLYSRIPHPYWSVYQEAETEAKTQELGIWDVARCVAN